MESDNMACQESLESSNSRLAGDQRSTAAVMQQQNISDKRAGGVKLDALTSLRFFAACLIIVEHAKGHFYILDALPENFIWNQGIAFFFVLSGFILCYIYPELPDHKGKVMFLAKRFA
ncbi:MAG: hypothetical protein SGJ27_12525, partial [Candidatus Melainabacteria bacterium]|nr:hypothetical protein [Candidatus Melainabacteria bacterium]